MSEVNRSDFLSAVNEFSELSTGRWAVPVGPGIEFMQAFYTEASMLTVSDAAKRYFGEYGNIIQFAQGYAAQSFAPPGEVLPELAQVDWSAWPFSHIDWFAAAMALRERIDDGSVMVIAGAHYFDAAPASAQLSVEPLGS